MRTVYKKRHGLHGKRLCDGFCGGKWEILFVGETDKATADEVVDLGGKFVCAGFK